jgi:hypothetical protein
LLAHREHLQKDGGLGENLGKVFVFGKVEKRPVNVLLDQRVRREGLYGLFEQRVEQNPVYAQVVADQKTPDRRSESVRYPLLSLPDC